MSQPNSAEPQVAATPLKPSGPAYQKQSINIYTMLLVIAFLALSIGSLLLYLELQRWGAYPWWRTGSLG